MKLRRVGLRPFSLRLTSRLSTAHGPIEERSGFLLCLEDEDGVRGLGEATPLVDFGTESLTQCHRALLEVGEALLADGRADLAQLSGTPCARAAIECALDDLEARCLGVSLATHWRSKARQAGLGVPGDEPTKRRVRIQALIGGNSPAQVSEATHLARAAGFRAFKLKVAGHSDGEEAFALDADRVAALRAAAGPSATLRLDANEGWTPAQALRQMTRFAKFEIDFVEQPVARADLDAMASLSNQSPIAVAADESLLGEGLSRVAARPEVAKVWVLKPAALGGLEPCLRAALLAQQQGIRVVWSSLLDGAISRMAATQWAAALGDENGIQGLGTGRLLSADFEDPARFEEGALVFPDRPGLGIDAATLFDGENPLFRGAGEWFGVDR